MSSPLASPTSGTLLRPHLLNRVTADQARPATVIVAPAGFGKSTLLAQAAERSGVVRLQAHEGGVLHWLDPPEHGDALVRADELAALFGRLPPPCVLALDDAQLLDETCEPFLTELLAEATPERRVVIASRRRLPPDMTGPPLDTQVLEIGPRELRFRFWEVAELFRSCYDDPLPPEVAAVLARRTAGWIAYVHLFHLATTGRPLLERVALLESLARRPWLLRDHLAHHVLASLPDPIQEFLLETCVLPILSSDLCDALREASGSRRLLDLVAAERLAIEQRADPDVYQYHPIVRLHLEAELTDRFGHAEAARRYRRAAELLEAMGRPEAALSCYAKAGAWEEVRRLAPRHHEHLGELRLGPGSGDEHDPLLVLARARRELAEGRFGQAAASFRAAAEASESSELARSCLDAAAAAERWSAPDPTLGLDPASILRAASIRDPARARRDAATLPGIEGALVEALAAILAGAVDEGLRLCERVQWNERASARHKAVAGMAACVVWLAQSRPVPPELLDALDDQVTSADWPWLERMLAGTVALASEEDDAMAVVDAWRVEGDLWGEGLLSLIGGSVALSRGAADESVELLRRSLAVFGRLGAGTLQAWGQWLIAVALSRTGCEAEILRAACQEAERLGETCAMPFVGAIGRLVWGRASGTQPTGELGPPELLAAGLHAFGLVRPVAPQEPEAQVVAPGADGTPRAIPPLPPPATASAWLRCLGSFGLGLGPVELNAGLLKPKERLVLQLLAARAGSSVHREELIEAVWPAAPPEPALRRLQVAVSAIRTRLEQCVGGEGAPTAPELRRIGDGYCLWLPEGSDVDLWRFHRALEEAHAARRSGDAETERRALRAALDAYGGPLLPDAGPDDWVVAERSQLQSLSSDAAERLAGLLLEAGEADEALSLIARALGHDRYRDGLWKLQIEAAERAGKPAEAEQARRGYQEVLGELGLLT